MKSNAGFTLIELMVTIAIIGILSAVVVPNMISWRNNAQFNSGVRQMKIAIDGTRMKAIKANMPSRMVFTDGGTTFATQKWDSVANAFAAAQTHQFPPGVRLANSNFGGAQLLFDGRGMPNTLLGGTLQIENTDGSLCRLIIVASVGTSRIDVCP